MEPLEITSIFDIYDSFEELPEDVQNLMDIAFEARNAAYAPYSKFKVGAALLMESGEVVIGSNQENASYPSGLCAERTAIFHAGVVYPEGVIKRMAISAKSLNHRLLTPIPPCGACRQVIAEYEVKQERPIELFFMGETGKVIRAKSIRELLPLIFDNSYL